MMEAYYLKPTVKVEPLIWQWYAWSHLISPATAACNIVNRHLKIMQSFIEAPEAHIQAAKNPRLLGGPFMSVDESYRNKVTQLLEQTKEDCDDLIELEKALKQFDTLLQSSAVGSSLEELYKQAPESLRGRVELVYDLNNHPSILLIEPLIYQKYYNTKFQKIKLYDSPDDKRDFILSTPRFHHANELHIDLPFSDDRLDILFSMREKPQSLEYIADLLQISANDFPVFKSLFTQDQPLTDSDQEYKGSGVRVRYFGHACILLQTDKVSILIDPLISYQSNSIIKRYTFNDLPSKIDYVLLTHNHQDHVIIETLIQLRHKIGTVVIPKNSNGSLADPSLKLIFQSLGFNSLITLEEFETIQIKSGSIMGLPFLGEHSDLNIQTKLAHYVQLKGKTFYFAADSNNIEPMLYEHVSKFIGNVDQLFIGMECDGAPLSWLYGPLLTKPLDRKFNYSRKLSGSNSEKAWEIIKTLNCKSVYIYAMGQEPWLGHIMALNCYDDSIQITESNYFIKKCKENGIAAERLYALKEWEVKLKLEEEYI
jgi:L-ascorbate metabolism protein UlaG (beta-lactamase superfamily)